MQRVDPGPLRDVVRIAQPPTKLEKILGLDEVGDLRGRGFGGFDGIDGLVVLEEVIIGVAVADLGIELEDVDDVDLLVPVRIFRLDVQLDLRIHDMVLSQLRLIVKPFVRGQTRDFRPSKGGLR